MVKAGQVVKVKVLEVDEKRKRIALTMRLTDTPQHAGVKPEQKANSSYAKRVMQHRQHQSPPPAVNNAMAAAFAKLKS